MASKTSEPENYGPAIKLVDLSARLTRRKAELGIVEPVCPERVEGRNSGKRRTESKKALLKAIEAAGGKW
jgi:hypothetical protein